MLTGAIPISLESLSNLTDLYLADNSFTGCVPVGLYTVTDHDLDDLSISACVTETTATATDHGGDRRAGNPLRPIRAERPAR